MRHAKRSCGLPHSDLTAAFKNGGLACSLVRVDSALQGQRGLVGHHLPPRYTDRTLPRPARLRVDGFIHPYVGLCLFSVSLETPRLRHLRAHRYEW